MICEKCGQGIQRLNGEPLPCCNCSDAQVISRVLRQRAPMAGFGCKPISADDCIFRRVDLQGRAWLLGGVRHRYWSLSKYDGEPLFEMRA